jgi:hypothetical protein
MATVEACSYLETGTTPTLASFYAQDATYQRMADFLVHAASHFGIRAGVALAVGDLENNGAGNNWMGLGSDAVSDFQTFWDDNNGPGTSAPTADQISAIDSLNAAVGIYYLVDIKSNCDYTNWQGILSKCSAYNGICGCPCPYSTAYGWSSLFLAYGENYATISDYAYNDAYYPTAPTGSQTSYRGCNEPATLEVPDFGITYGLRTTPYGRNSNGRQIVLLGRSAVDYVSCLQIDINLYSTPYDQPVTTGDSDFAAGCAQDRTICTICVGEDAVTDIMAACPTCTSYPTFAAWKAGSDPGFVNAAGANRTDSYDMGNTAATAASEAGW